MIHFIVENPSNMAGAIYVDPLETPKVIVFCFGEGMLKMVIVWVAMGFFLL
jgi:hypothetical protein